MAGGELHLVDAEGIFNDQVAAIVLSRRIQEEGGRKIRADPMWGSGYLTNRIVNVVAKRLTTFVPVEEWRKYFQREGGRHEQGTAFKGRQNGITQLPRRRLIFW